MTHYADLADQGYHLLRHHDRSFDVKYRLVSFACRIGGPDHGEGEGYDQFGILQGVRPNWGGEETHGDITNWLMWKPDDAGGTHDGVNNGTAAPPNSRPRTIPGWAQAWASITLNASAPGDANQGGSTTSNPKSGTVDVLPAFSQAWDADGRFAAKTLPLPPLFDNVPKGIAGVVLAGTNEYKQEELFLPCMPNVLVAPHENGDPNLGTLVYDLTGKDELDRRRRARLQTLARVWEIPRGGVTQAIFGPARAHALAIQMGPARGGVNGRASFADVGDGGGPFPVEILGAASNAAGGCLNVGSVNDKHRFGKNSDEDTLNSLHISTNAYFYRDAFADAPLAFGGLWEPAGSAGQLWETFLRYDNNSQHSHPTGAKAGLWRLETRVPVFYPPPPDDGTNPFLDGTFQTPRDDGINTGPMADQGLTNPGQDGTFTTPEDSSFGTNSPANPDADQTFTDPASDGTFTTPNDNGFTDPLRDSTFTTPNDNGLTDTARDSTFATPGDSTFGTSPNDDNGTFATPGDSGIGGGGVVDGPVVNPPSGGGGGRGGVGSGAGSGGVTDGPIINTPGGGGFVFGNTDKLPGFSDDSFNPNTDGASLVTFPGPGEDSVAPWNPLTTRSANASFNADGTVDIVDSMGNVVQHFDNESQARVAWAWLFTGTDVLPPNDGASNLPTLSTLNEFTAPSLIFKPQPLKGPHTNVRNSPSWGPDDITDSQAWPVVARLESIGGQAVDGTFTYSNAHGAGRYGKSASGMVCVMPPNIAFDQVLDGVVPSTWPTTSFNYFNSQLTFGTPHYSGKVLNGFGIRLSGSTLAVDTFDASGNVTSTGTLWPGSSPWTDTGSVVQLVTPSRCVVIQSACITSSNQTNSESFGETASTSSTGSTSVGNSAQTGLNGVAVGYQSNGTGNNATAVGKGAVATGTGACTLGAGASATAADAIAIGDPATCGGTHSIVIGGGTAGITSASGAIAIGYASGAGTSSVTVGDSAVSAEGVGKQNNVAIGASSHAYTTDGVAIGYLATCADNSVSIGSHASGATNRLQATCIGAVSFANDNSCAFGYNSFAGAGTIALGRDSDSSWASQTFSAGSPNYPITLVCFGKGGNANATPLAVTLQNTPATGTNVAGTGDLIVIPSLATGNAASAKFSVQTGDTGASGSTLQTATEKFKVDPSGAWAKMQAGTKLLDWDIIKVYINANQLIASGAFANINWTSSLIASTTGFSWSAGGAHPDRISVVTAGKIRVEAQGYWAFNNTGDRAVAIGQWDSTVTTLKDLAQSTHPATTVIEPIQVACGTFDCAANDVITVAVRQDSGGNLNAKATYTEVCCTRVTAM